MCRYYGLEEGKKAKKAKTIVCISVLERILERVLQKRAISAAAFHSAW